MSLIRSFVLLIIAQLCASAASATPPDPPTRVFLARHAESMSIPGNRDAPLTAAGMRRASALGQVLRSSDVVQVFASQFLRSHATAESVSVATHAPLEVVHSDSSAGLARMIRTRFHGKTVVIVGHSDSLPNVVAELGWEGAEAAERWRYDDLGLLEFRDGGPVQFVHLHYGGPADTTGMQRSALPDSQSVH